MICAPQRYYTYTISYHVTIYASQRLQYGSHTALSECFDKFLHRYLVKCAEPGKVKFEEAFDWFEKKAQNASIDVTAVRARVNAMYTIRKSYRQMKGYRDDIVKK